MKIKLRFLEKYFLRIFLGLAFFLLLVLYFLELYTSENFLKYFVTSFKFIAIIDNGNLVTISTVIIGIYFSLYTYILSADSNSFISNLKSYKEFSLLISMVNRGFGSSFLLVLLSFSNEWLYGKFDVKYLFLVGVLCIIIFGSLLQIALYYFLIFKYDFKKKFEETEKQKISDYEDLKLKVELKEFLKKQKLKEQQDRYYKKEEL